MKRGMVGDNFERKKGKKFERNGLDAPFCERGIAERIEAARKTTDTFDKGTCTVLCHRVHVNYTFAYAKLHARFRKRSIVKRCREIYGID